MKKKSNKGGKDISGSCELVHKYFILTTEAISLLEKAIDFFCNENRMSYVRFAEI